MEVSESNSYPYLFSNSFTELFTFYLLLQGMGDPKGTKGNACDEESDGPGAACVVVSGF